jgi:hypothetical protein
MKMAPATTIVHLSVRTIPPEEGASYAYGRSVRLLTGLNYRKYEKVPPGLLATPLHAGTCVLQQRSHNDSRRIRQPPKPWHNNSDIHSSTSTTSRGRRSRYVHIALRETKIEPAKRPSGAVNPDTVTRNGCRGRHAWNRC